MLDYLKTKGIELPYADDFNGMGRLSAHTGLLIGVVGYNGFNGNVCMMHCAGDGNWISRDFLRQAFAYPFVQLKLSYLFATVAATNHRAMKLNRHLGFEVLHRLPDGWKDGEDMILMRMRRNQCRWIKEREHELKVA